MIRSESFMNKFEAHASHRNYHHHVKQREKIKKTSQQGATAASVSDQERYVAHRKAAEASRRKKEQQRIERANQLHLQKLAEIETKGKAKRKKRQAPSGPKSPRPKGQVRNPIKSQELMASNIGLLRRIVAVKPFASREDWAKHRKQNKEFLRRLHVPRKERNPALKRPSVMVPSAPKKPATANTRRPTSFHRPRISKPIESIAPPVIKNLAAYADQAKARHERSSGSVSGASSKLDNNIQLLEADFEKLFCKSARKSRISIAATPRKSLTARRAGDDGKAYNPLESGLSRINSEGQDGESDNDNEKVVVEVAEEQGEAEENEEEATEVDGGQQEGGTSETTENELIRKDDYELESISSKPPDGETKQRHHPEELESGTLNIDNVFVRNNYSSEAEHVGADEG